MFQIISPSENTLIIEKSKFITYLFPIDSEQQAKESLQHIKKLHPKATHHCSAYIVANIKRSNDDNEPASTAGAPMLKVLSESNMTNILAVVVRYFGGTLLGKGGLIRAYSSSVSEALKHAEIYQEQPIYKVIFTVPYALTHVIEALIDNTCFIVKRDFQEEAYYELDYLNEDFIDNLIDLTLNQITILNTSLSTRLIKKDITN